MKRVAGWFSALAIVTIAVLAWQGAAPHAAVHQAGEAACDAQSPGAPPTLSERLARNTTLLCYRGYVVRYSAVSRTPIWSAERLTPARVRQARRQIRTNAFHPDPFLGSDASQLADYRHHPGLDRGHLSPNGDMSDPQAAYEAFSLANIIPQDSQNNRRIWSDLEIAVRNAAERGDVYVVTGPLFLGSQLRLLNGRVLVPTHIYKAIYSPALGIAGVYVSSNDSSQTYDQVSLARFAASYGIDPFPTAPLPMREALALPPVIRHH